MAVARINKEQVNRLKPTNSDQLVWDDRLKGFGVKMTRADEVSGRGGVISYVVQYRPKGRPTMRRFTLGRHGALTPDEAREKARDVLESIRKGSDPLEEKKAKKQEAVELAFDKYAERFLDRYGPAHWSEATQRDNKRYLTAKDSPVVAILEKRPLPEIRRSHIAAVFDELPMVESGFKNPGLARNLYAVLRRLFAWAVERGDLDRSPMEGFKGPAPVASRDRVLNDVEIRLAWNTAGAAGYPFGPFYRLLILTGQRKSEVASVDWRRLNRKARTWTMTAADTKNDQPHIVHLSDAAVAILDECAGGADWPNKGYVFSTNGKRPIAGFSKAKAALDKAIVDAAGEDFELEPWRVHDLRRTFATGLQRLGIRFEVTEACLNHVSGAKSGVAGIYQRHDWRDEKVAAFNAWASHLKSILASRDTSNVIPIKAAQ